MKPITKKELEIIGKLISELNTACGKLIVPSMKDNLIKEAMEQVCGVSFELGNLI